MDNFFVRTQLSANVQDVVTLIDTGVFVAPVLKPFQEPVFIALILKFNDLLQKLAHLGHRVSFTEDILDGDITDLVNKLRNAICHLDSGENTLDGEQAIKFVFNVIIGKGTFMAIGDQPIVKSDYGDDIAVFYGPHRIYLNRHIVRAIKEAQGKIKTIYSNETATHTP